MRIRRAIIAVALMGAATVACDPPSDQSVPSTTRHTTTITDPCKIASKLPAYSVTESDGTRIDTPSGADLVKEASMDGLNGAGLTRACQTFIIQFCESPEWPEDNCTPATLNRYF